MNYRYYIYKDLQNKSFFSLIDGIKEKYPNDKLSVNNDFLSNFSISPKERLRLFNKKETLLNEIAYTYDDYIVDKSAYQNADKVIENFINKYINILLKHRNNLQIYLSGGYDSRICLMLLLLSGINLKDVIVHSIDLCDSDDHKKDFYIANLLSKKFGFNLNRSFNNFKSLSDTEIFDIFKYHCDTPFFNKQICSFKSPVYTLNGIGGDMLHTKFSIKGGYYNIITHQLPLIELNSNFNNHYICPLLDDDIRSLNGMSSNLNIDIMKRYMNSLLEIPFTKTINNVPAINIVTSNTFNNNCISYNIPNKFNIDNIIETYMDILRDYDIV